MLVELDTRILESFEIAATLDAILAEPGARPKRHRAIVMRLCADQIAVTIEAFPERRAELVGRYPHYNPSKVRTQTGKLQDGRDDALKVGAAVLALIARTATGEEPRLPNQCKRTNLDQITPFLWQPEPWENEETYLIRIHDLERTRIRRRYPVAHLAAAMQWLARELAGQEDSASWDYQDLAFLRRLVSKANEIAELIGRTPGLERMAEQLIEFRWIEGAHTVAA